MSKIFISIIILIVIIGGIFYLFNKPEEPKKEEPPVKEFTNDPLNTTYIINDKEYALVDGKVEKEIVPGSASVETVNAFKTETKADFNGDGLEDVLVVLTYNGGGTGTFFFVAAALNQGSSYKGTNGIILGDRIDIESTYFEKGVIFVNYLDRELGEPMTAEPSVKIVKRFVLREGELVKLAGNNLIYVTSPLPEQEVSSPLTIEGEARGNWYFEADFPVVLVNWDGLIIGEGIARAQDEWMTEDFVPFTATIEFESPFKEGDQDFMKRGGLILQKDNPSGLPENDDAIEFAIFFK